jgi:hypothetical protein
MGYRGVEYEVVQTITNTWRWSVKHENAYKVGIALDRKSAELCAERFIDGLVKKRSNPVAYLPPPEEGL